MIEAEYNIFEDLPNFSEDTLKILEDDLSKEISKNIINRLFGKMAKKSDYRAGTILVDERGRIFLHDGNITADGLCMVCEYDPTNGEFLWSSGIGNFCNGCSEFRIATAPELEDFLNVMMRRRDKKYY